MREVLCPHCRAVRRTKARGRVVLRCHHCGASFLAGQAVEHVQGDELDAENGADVAA